MAPLVEKWRIIANVHYIWTSSFFVLPFLLKHNHETQNNLPKHPNNCKLWTGKVPNIPKTNAIVDPCIKKAITFLQKCLAATVKEGMIIAGFSKKEIKDWSKKAWIYRHHKKRDANTIPPSESVTVPKSGEGATVSSILLLSSNNENITVHYSIKEDVQTHECQSKAEGT